MSSNISRRQLISTGIAAVGGTLATAALAADKETSEKDKPHLKGQLSLEELERLLKGLGLKLTKVESRFDFAFDAKLDNEWKMGMTVFLSSDGDGIWITAWLDELPKSSADVPRTALLRLLAENDKMGRVFFAYSSGNRRFALNKFVKNENVTAASMKNDLLELAHEVIDTQEIWQVAQWKQPSSSPGKDSAAEASASAEGKPSELKSTTGAKPIKSASSTDGGSRSSKTK
jgi:hypothetical protein